LGTCDFHGLVTEIEKGSNDMAVRILVKGIVESPHDVRAYFVNRCPITNLTSPPDLVNAFGFRNKENAHENEPRHPFIRHTLGQVVRHEDIQQQLQKRVKHVEHDEEVKQRDGNVEDMLESDRRHANEYASKRIRNEQTG